MARMPSVDTKIKRTFDGITKPPVEKKKDAKKERDPRSRRERDRKRAKT